MSSQVPSQFLYSRSKALGLLENLYLSGESTTLDSTNRYLIPTIPTVSPISSNGFFWNGQYDETGKPLATTNTDSDFAIHIDHPDLKSRTYNDFVRPNATGKNQIYPLIRHAKYFDLRDNEQNANVQLGYKNTTINNTYWEQVENPGGQTFEILSNYQDKLGFSPNDRYLIGKKTCGAYLMLAPANVQQLMVNGTDYRSTYVLEQGEDKAIRIPVLFQFRMTDYFGTGSSGLGKVGGHDPYNTIEPTNLTFSKKIGLDLYVKDESPFSFDILIKASYARESLTQVVQAPGFIDRTRRAVRDFFKN
jgi:hypothetical protein